jgi:hypothetical protein
MGEGRRDGKVRRKYWLGQFKKKPLAYDQANIA